MSGRKNTNRYKLESSKSLAASFTTTPTMITFMDNCSYQINITTSNSTGTFTVQGSDDYQAASSVQQPVTGSWIDLPLGGDTAAPIANAANDNIIINMNQLPFNAIRIIYTSTIAGTGTCDIWIVEKQL